MSTNGSTSVAANDFRLASEGVPPGKMGVFFYGLAQVHAFDVRDRHQRGIRGKRCQVKTHQGGIRIVEDKRNRGRRRVLIGLLVKDV